MLELPLLFVSYIYKNVVGRIFEHTNGLSVLFVVMRTVSLIMVLLDFVGAILLYQLEFKLEKNARV